MLAIILVGMGAQCELGAQVCGDCAPTVPDGISSIVDALVAAQNSAGLVMLTGTPLAACDVEPRLTTGACDGDVDILDALIIAQASAGLILQLECCLGPPPGSPHGRILAPNVGTHRGEIPVRIAALDDERDLLALEIQYSTNAGAAWSNATMSAFVNHYPAFGFSYVSDADGASYHLIAGAGGTGVFQTRERVTGMTSGATGFVYQIIAQPPTARLVIDFESGAFVECETLVGASSAATMIIDGVSCGAGASGIGLYARVNMLGTGLFAPPAPASTANPVLSVYPGRALVFVWDSAIDIPVAASPATVMMRALLDDGVNPPVGISGGTFTVDNRPSNTDHLLITEVCVTGAEFVEIHNPTALPIDLSNYYLSDATFASGMQFYWNLATGGSTGGGAFSDWTARFPAGASIQPGAYLIVAGSNAQYASRYGIDADFEMCLPCSGAVPCMREAGDGIDSVATCGSAGGTTAITDSGEMLILFFWNGVASTVSDIDYIVWGDQDEAIDKSGVPGYLPDTPIAMQSILPPGFPEGDLHNVLFTASRIDLNEGAEIQSGGNGVSGHDETSEDFENTWVFAAIPTPGRRNIQIAAMDDLVAIGDVTINEVCYDPNSDSNGDSVFALFDDAFIEIVNTASAPIDLSLWRIFNVRTVFGVSHEFPPGTILDPGQAVVVWGAGSPTGNPCNRINQISNQGGLFFNLGSSCAASDGIVLVNGGVYMDGNYECANNINASFTRNPDLTGPFVGHPATAGALEFSPGCRSDGLSGF